MKKPKNSEAAKAYAKTQLEAETGNFLCYSAARAQYMLAVKRVQRMLADAYDDGADSIGLIWEMVDTAKKGRL